MFRTVFPSIIRSSRLYIQQQVYVQSRTPDDGRKDRPKHVECYSKNKINLRDRCIYLVLLLKYITMHGPMNVKSKYNESRSLKTNKTIRTE
jgi:hypothetical protein